MKKSILAGALLVGMLFALSPLVSHAQSSEESVLHFAATLEVHADATVAVTERIIYDFGSNERHGIYRDIPVVYPTTLGKTSIKLSNVSVKDETGKGYEFEVSSSGKDKEIKIGDPDVLISGTKTYIISYTVARAAGYFADYDELYWNVTGNEWQVPIQDASAEVTLPKAISKKDIRAACYQGSFGSSAACASFTVGVSNEATDDTDHVYFASSALLPGEGLTVAVGFPKGVIYEPTMWERVVQTVKDNWIVGMPLLVLLCMWYVWYRKGRDPKGRGTIIAEYESPDALTPIETSALMHGSVKNSALSAEIVYLASKGYLSITRTEEKGLVFTSHDYTLKRLKQSEGLPEFDRLLLDGIFTSDEVRLSELKNKFYKNLPDIKKAVMKSVIQKKYYPTDPQNIIVSYVLGGILLGFVLVVLGAATDAGALNIVSGILSGLIVIVFAFVMPKVTQKGAEAKEKVKGLELYLNVAEKDRINFHNAPEKNPQLFEKLLPFAMVLGVEAAWAKQFEGMYMPPPGWYNDSSGAGFNSVIFANSMHSFSDTARSNLVSAPQGGSGSGGGGFSGGGGGGGGGGSW